MKKIQSCKPDSIALVLFVGISLKLSILNRFIRSYQHQSGMAQLQLYVAATITLLLPYENYNIATPIATLSLLQIITVFRVI